MSAPEAYNLLCLFAFFVILFIYLFNGSKHYCTLDTPGLVMLLGKLSLERDNSPTEPWP